MCHIINIFLTINPKQEIDVGIKQTVGWNTLIFNIVHRQFHNAFGIKQEKKRMLCLVKLPASQLPAVLYYHLHIKRKLLPHYGGKIRKCNICLDGGVLKKNNGNESRGFMLRLIDVTQAGAPANKSLINRVVCVHVAAIQDLFRRLLQKQ